MALRPVSYPQRSVADLERCEESSDERLTDDEAALMLLAALRKVSRDLARESTLRPGLIQLTAKLEGLLSYL
jgi:hypothetical protein